MMMAACTPKFESDEEEVIQENTENTEEQQSIVPSQISEEDYQTIIPYQPSAARGIITSQLQNSYDVDEFERGLIRHAKSTFSPEEYLFQEGQYLTDDMVLGWIDDLNPDDKFSQDYDYHMENPRIFSHVLEHNYLVRSGENSVELGGMVIGIALKSQYEFSIEGTTHYRDISYDEMLETGKKVTESILTRIRNNEDLQEVPIMVALYRQNENNAIVPGNFVAKAEVEPLAQTFNEWQSIGEKHVLFPSDEAQDEFTDQAELISDFRREVEDYFPNYIGVVGKGFYSGDELQELTINVNVEFNGRQEIVGLTQHLYSSVLEYFPNHYDIDVTIESERKQEALIFRKAGEEEPEYHIYD